MGWGTPLTLQPLGRPSPFKVEQAYDIWESSLTPVVGKPAKLVDRYVRLHAVILNNGTKSAMQLNLKWVVEIKFSGDSLKPGQAEGEQALECDTAKWDILTPEQCGSGNSDFNCPEFELDPVTQILLNLLAIPWYLEFKVPPPVPVPS